MRVAAVIVTRNRSPVLAETLHGVVAQTRPPEAVYVVDNASDDDTEQVVRREFPSVVYLRQTDNLGPPGGHAVGMRTALENGIDAFWLMDDDSHPHPDALESLLMAASAASPRTGMIGCRGGVIRFGRIRHLVGSDQLARQPAAAPGIVHADFVVLDGSLVLRRAVDAIGFPPKHYFAMMEDIEYPLRVRKGGFDVLLLDRDLMQREHLGSAPGTSLWRGYYQARNHVRMALDLRSPVLLLGCAGRQLWALASALLRPDQRWKRVRLRVRGVWDGLRGKMGRTLDPDDP
jgi:rhamnopyranosyl-N-acetylglucosaminyl-diphospho-decaprenol beta-1,3/1,4-galactofuranosyltransferase